MPPGRQEGIRIHFRTSATSRPLSDLEAGPVAARKTGADCRIANDPGWKLASPEGVRGDHLGESR